MSLLPILLFFTGVFLAVAILLVVTWRGIRLAGSAPAEADDENRPESSPLLKQDELSTISIWAHLLARFDFVERMRVRIGQAELDWSVGRVTLLMLLCGAVTFAVTGNIVGAPFWAVVLASGGGAFLPYGYVLRRRTRRFIAIEEQFPDALDSMARALRAGHPFAAALNLVGRETEPPLATELTRTSAEVNLGTSWDEAIGHLAERLPLPEVGLFAAAVQLHNRTGGKLGEVLGTLSETMRESVALRGEVRALAAHGRMSGAVLTLLPIVIAGMLMVVNPAYLVSLYVHPAGKNLIAGAIGCVLVGHFLIRKIVDIKP
jgi:tight adherence protein B